MDYGYYINFVKSPLVKSIIKSSSEKNNKKFWEFFKEKLLAELKKYLAEKAKEAKNKNNGLSEKSSSIKPVQ